MAYSSGDIIGKTLKAISTVKIVKSPYDNSPVLRTIAPGVIVGVVDSYYLPKSGRSNMYWGFKDTSGNNYYAVHKPGLYDERFLKEQGLIKEEDKNKPQFEIYLKKYGLPLVLIIGGIVIAKAYVSNH